jgi:acetyl-CoA carboxylase carboxyl transferase subunit alpha
MLEHAYFSVAAPEAAAAILWRDASRAPDAAAGLGITADALLEAGIIDRIIPEPPGGAHRSPDIAARVLAECLTVELDQLLTLTPAELLEARYERYRSVGPFGWSVE